MNIGILGGTFNPIHYGHTFIAQYILNYLKLDKILFIPSGKPPHKSDVIGKRHRLYMTYLATKDNENFEIDDIEIKSEIFSYTYHTMKTFIEKNKNDKYYFIIGQDAFLEIDKWYEYKRLLEMVTFVVVVRGEDVKEKLKDMYDGADVVFVDTPVIQISSTDIRNRVRDDKSIAYYVNKDVERYIINNKLYR